MARAHFSDESMVLPAKPRTLKKIISDNTGFMFILPWLIGLIIFKLYPFAMSLYYSFTDYNLIKEPTFIGFKNYISLLDNDLFLKSMGITFKYAFMTVPLKLAFALFIAYILNLNIKGVKWFRTAYYIPSILGGSVAIAVLWRFLFADTGFINLFLSKIGIEGPAWLGDPKYALFTLCLLRVWQFGSAMVIFLAALKGVPGELYEAASIDGAGKVRQFFSVTLPMITPVVFYNFVTQLVQAFQEFNGPYIITQGGPLDSTTLTSLLVYKNAFSNFKMGYANAMAWYLFIAIMLFTAIAFISQKYWVYYSDEER